MKKQKWYTRDEALEYLKRNGKKISPSGLDYHVNRGNINPVRGLLPERDHPRTSYIKVAELDALIEKGRGRGATPEGFGDTIITPPMFYTEGYALRVLRGQVSVTLDGQTVTDVYPESDTSRWYIAVFTDGTSGRVWNRTSLIVKEKGKG